MKNILSKGLLQKIIIVMIFLIINAVSYPQKLNNATVYFDYAKFKSDSSVIYLELYYSILLNALNEKKDSAENNVKADIEIKIFNDSTKTLLADKVLKVKSIVQNDIESRENKFIPGLYSFLLKPGDYLFKIDVRDINDTTNHHNLEFPVRITAIDENKFYVSGIELATNIIEAAENKNSMFYKNTYLVLPNPSLIFGEGLPTLFYYTELYNIQKTKEENPLTLLVTITDNQGKVKLRKQKPIVKKFNSMVEVGTFNISKLISGTYTIMVGIVDTTTGEGMLSSKKFFIYNKNVKDTTLAKTGDSDYLSSEFSVMSDEELLQIWDQSKYIASNDEIKQWNQLGTLDSKKQFLFSFWKSRDQDPTTSINETKEGYFKRVDYANQYYTTGKNLGWKSDRGRVLLIYGEPSEIERFPNEMDSYPYEVWYYNQLEGGCIFVFGDLTGISQLMLLHSTYRGELRDDNWYNRIKRSK